LLQVFTVEDKHNVACVRITCNVGSSVSEEFTVCVFMRLSVMEVVVCFRAVSIPDYFVSSWKETVAVPFGLKCGHEMAGGTVFVIK
jgi:hypothetical protein